jgi:hypothetical protein
MTSNARLLVLVPWFLCAMAAEPVPPATEKAAPPPSEQAAPPAAKAETRVRRLDAGAEPRRELRFQLEVGSESTQAMEMRVVTTTEMGGMKMPAVKPPATKMSFTLRVLKLTPEGHYECSLKLGKPEILEEAGTGAAVAAAMKKALANIEKVTGSFVMTRSGRMQKVELNIPPDLQGQVRQSMNSMIQSLQQLSNPFPEEPVGNGARWEVTMPIDTAAFSMSQVSTFTAKRILEDRVEVDVSLVQTAPKQPFRIPGGMNLALESLASEGKGSTIIELKRMVTTSSVKAKTAMEFDVKQANGENPTRVKSSVEMDLKVYPVTEGAKPETPAAGE